MMGGGGLSSNNTQAMEVFIMRAQGMTMANGPISGLLGLFLL